MQMAMAQQTSPCGTDELLRDHVHANPALNQKIKGFEQAFKDYIETIDLSQFKANKLGKTGGPPKYIIPVVFHILHDNGGEKISNQRCKDEITILNRNFRAASTFRDRVRPIFKDIEADAQIEFRLAKLDPKGNPTNGIERIYVGPLADKANDNVKLNSWNPQGYLNIWVAGGIQINTPFSVGGYAYIPPTAPRASVDGIIVLASTVGNISSPSPFDYNTVGHEAGHYLGLRHPFQNSPIDTCSLDGDLCFDTPPTFFTPGEGRFTGISTRNFCAKPDSNTCSSDNPDLPDQYENYMDYFSGPCSNNMFTVQQVALMHFSLNNYRRGLWADANLVATGVKDSAFDSKPIPVPAFSISGNQSLTETRICVDNLINFRDGSWNADVTSWEWNFGEGAVPATHIGEIPPAVKYTTPGKKTVTLKVANANGENTLVAKDYVTVEGPGDSKKGMSISADWDYLNNFIQEGWYFETEVPNVNPWQRIQNIQYDGIASIRLNTRATANFFRYSIVSPTYDLSSSSNNPYLQFYYAFAPNLTNIRINNGTASTIGDSQDNLSVSVSTDCGRTWQQKRVVGGSPSSGNQAVVNPLSTLAPNPTNNGATGVQAAVNFVPASTAQWKEYLVEGVSNIPKESNVRFKITFTASGGNFLYIDNLRMGLNTGLANLKKSDLRFNAYPNPFNQTITLTYNILVSTHASVKVYDITGREMGEVFNGNQSAGDQQITINRNDLGLSNGVYFVKLVLGDESSFVHKIIVE